MTIRNEKVYLSQVEKCRSYLKTYKQQTAGADRSRKKICAIAVKVREYCKLTVFANDIGMGKSYNLLIQWIRDYEKPTQELEKEQGDKIDHAALRRAKGRMNKDATPAQARKLYNEESKKSPEDIRLDVFVVKLRTASFDICNSYVLNTLSKDTLEEIKIHCMEISNKLNVFLGATSYKASRNDTSKQATEVH